jgi:TetR/AcrR family transcriptional regulator, fatty acid metabolism regulator protein
MAAGAGADPEMSKCTARSSPRWSSWGKKREPFGRDLYVGLVKRLINGAVEEVINTWIHTGMDHDLVSMAEPLVDLFIRGIGTENEIAP